MTVTADKRDLSRLKKYTNFWQSNSALDGDADESNRRNAYADVTNAYYDGATELYEFGWSSSFHFCRFFPGEGFTAALARHEYSLASKIGLKAGMRVLDVGCGIGGPARNIARFSDANIVGINNNDFQVARAQKYTAEAGLANQVTFEKGDFTKMAEQFGENSFDAVYAFEATCHAPTLEGVYSEIYKVLKPGGMAGILEWVMTDSWDPANPVHKDVQYGVEVGCGISRMQPVQVARDAINAVGFEVITSEDLAERDDAIPWYHPLEGKITEAQNLSDAILALQMTRAGISITHHGLRLAEFLGLVPAGTHDVAQKMRVSGEALVKGGQMKLFTPMYLFVVRKPLDAK